MPRKTRKQRGGSTGNAIVIVEPREHKLLKAVIQNVHERMPLDWDLYVFHGKTREPFAKRAAAVQGRKVILKALPTDNLVGQLNYNSLLLSKDFWEQIAAENILVFQTDSVLCARPLRRAIDEFLQYSYIGCSYDNTFLGKKSPWPGQPFYGIGGLSFRKKSFMLQCLKTPGRPTHAEDVAFSWCLEALPGAMKPPTAQTIANFCAQDTLHTNRPFGVHKTATQFKRDKRRLFQVCPEAELLEDKAPPS